MKKSCLIRSLITNATGILVFVSTCAWNAHATTELDRKYALETIGFLRSWDNVDGLFVDYVAASYKEYFSKQSRFTFQDLSKADTAIMNSKLPYQKVIEDPDILGQLARSTRTQSILRTKVLKEGKQYRFTVDWLHSPGMELLATDSFVLEAPSDGQAFGLGDIKGALQKSLDRLFAKVPFLAHVTGRDNNSVTVNMGNTVNVKKGDTLVIATLDEVKKHPLLKSIVDWRLTPTGKVEVEQVDEGMAFCKVLEEEPGRAISKYQKISQLIPKPEPEVPKVIDETKVEDKEDEPPKLGYISGGAWTGSFSRQYSTSSSGVNGGGILLGAKADGQIWMTREWFGEFGFAYGFWGQCQSAIGATGACSGVGSGSVSQFRIAAGYSYLITGDIFGPRGWLKLGYRSTSYTLPTSLPDLAEPISFKALILTVGGDLPIRDGWGAVLNLDFGVLTGSTQDSTAGFQTTNGGSDISFFAGGYYRIKPRITLRLGFDIQANGADLIGGGNLSQKIISIVPSVLYYF